MHHEPFEYYKSTANLLHTAPSSVSEVGHSDASSMQWSHRVNHQYDISWFKKAIEAGNMPQVSFLKAPAALNGHPGNSDPLDEQKFLVEQINMIENSQYWKNTAIFIAYDDSDGWYDHQVGRRCSRPTPPPIGSPVSAPVSSPTKARRSNTPGAVASARVARSC
jgi:phospholipase C